MQPTHISSLPSFCSSFQKHRAGIDHLSLAPILSLTSPIAAPARASMLTPPMSGSPPPELPAELQQLAGRRRKRSDTPPSTSGPSVPSPQSPYEHPAQRTAAHPSAGLSLAELSARVVPSPQPYSSPQAYGSGAGYPLGPLSASAPGLGPGPLSPRAVRKTKAHVASACVNCKKKHLRCDSQRPCRRCVQSGKEDSCHDVEHKKRGRPPLKPEDPSARRQFETALGPLTSNPQDPSRRLPAADPQTYSQSNTYPRNIRPFQAGSSHDLLRASIRPTLPYQSIYAPPSISPSPNMALGSFITGRSYPGPSDSTLPPSSYLMSPPPGSDALLRPSYSSQYSYPPPSGHMMPPTQPGYSNPIFPRQRPPSPQVIEPPVGLYGTSSLQLPPIRPAPQGGVIDPAIAQQQWQPPQPGRSPQGRDESSREPDSKRPKMAIQGMLGPGND